MIAISSEVDTKLKAIMKEIHLTAYHTSVEYGCAGNYVLGATIAAFLKLAQAMQAQGVV
jgi:glutamate dehydrogenase (NADP+)